MHIIIKKKGWLKQKYHACIVANNGKTIFSSEKITNLSDLETTIKNMQKEIPKAIVTYEGFEQD